MPRYRRGRRHRDFTKTDDKDANLIGWWKFDGHGTVETDASGSGLHGRFHGDPTRVNGQINGAVDFTSGDLIVANGGNTTLDPSQMSTGFTWMAWINADSDGMGDAGRIMDKGSHHFRVEGESGGEVNIDCAVAHATTQARVDTSDKVPLNTWTHVGMVYNRLSTKHIEVYISGSLATLGFNRAGVGNITSATGQAFVIGRQASAANYHFDGTIDDVRIYSRALTAAEVKSIYDDTA